MLFVCVCVNLNIYVFLFSYIYTSMFAVFSLSYIHGELKNTLFPPKKKKKRIYTLRTLNSLIKKDRRAGVFGCLGNNTIKMYDCNISFCLTSTLKNNIHQIMSFWVWNIAELWVYTPQCELNYYIIYHSHTGLTRGKTNGGTKKWRPIMNRHEWWMKDREAE